MKFDLNNRCCYWFNEISKVPRPSFEEKAISDFVVQFAKDHNLKCRQDEVWNVFVEKEATPGYEDKEPLMIQGHMDMVPGKRPGSSHNFSKDPIQLIEENGILKTKDTTLGADDGLGVAWMLALLEDDSITHPKLECIFTVQEEVGLGGARNMNPEDLIGNRLISVDCCNEGVTDLCCAGGAYGYADAELKMESNTSPAYRIFVDGLKGGHSGADIHLERASAVQIIGRVFEMLMADGVDVHMVSVTSTAKANAIPRECKAVFTSSTDPVSIDERVQYHAGKIAAELKSGDPDFRYVCEPTDAVTEAADTDSTQNFIDFLFTIPQGFQHKSMEETLHGLTVTSLNLGTVETEGKHIRMTILMRSMFDSAVQDLSARLSIIARRCNVSYKGTEFFPGWEYAEVSPIRDKYEEALRKQGRELKKVAEHGGLEVGIFSSLRPGLDITTVGADCRYFHTYDEEMDIASFVRGYETLKTIVQLCTED